MDYFFIISFHLFLLQNIINKYINQFKLFDEAYFIIICIMFFIIIMLRPKRIGYISKQERKIIKWIPIFFIVGIFANVKYRYQLQNIAIIKDMLAISKFIICYLFILIIGARIDKEILLKKIAKQSRVYILIIFAFGIVNLVFDIGMGHGNRYGIRAYKFLYDHPTYLVCSIVVLISVLIAEGTKNNNKYIMMSLIILLLTCRSKAIVYVFIYFFMSYILKHKVKIKLSHILCIAVIGLILTYSKIMEYVSYGYKAARPALYLTGFTIFKENFPFGSGFGTFASYLSGKYYSDVYYHYNLYTVLGMTKDNYSYIGDTFWPYIYGQFGCIGLIIFLYILFSLVLSAYRRYSYSLNKFKSMILLLIYVLIASTSEAIFTDSTGQFAFMVFSVFLGSNNLNKKLGK